MKNLILHLPLFLLSLGAIAGLQAQNASLHGRVSDESGAVVPRATVTVTSGQAVAQTATANGLGSYSFPNLPPGNYRVQASAPDLSQREPTAIVLKPGDQALDLVVQVTAKTQRITVEADTGPALGTDQASNANSVVLEGAALDALSDDPDDLQADLQALAGPSAGPNGGSIYVDGFSGADLPAKNAIREVRINQNPFSPEYDKLGYGRIEIFTKPGSDKYHATVDYNLGTELWNSRNPYAAEKAPFLLNEFEGGGGGPLGKRASFTVDAQHNMVDNGSISNGVALDPQTHEPSAFNSVVTSPQRFTKVSPRVDVALSDNHTLTARYGITHADIQNAGIGGFDLASRGYHSWYDIETAQVGETAVVGTTVNDVRFQYYRNSYHTEADSPGPQIQVLGAFNGGGASASKSFDTQNNFEFQNYTSMLRGAHSLRFGVRAREQGDDNLSTQNFLGTFIFGGGDLEPVLNAANQAVLDGSGQPLLAPITSIERYRRTLLGLSSALGGGPTQFSIAAGTPELALHQMDVGVFAADEWRARPNLTVSLGIRYEVQTNLHDWRDVAPRLALAWAPKGAKRGGRPKTVVRAGFGMFYDRFALANTLAAMRFNGVNQQQYVIANPDFFPNVPSPQSLGVAAAPQSIEQISSSLRAPYLMQSAITMERQLSANTTIAATYTNAHGLHLFRSDDINAPLPGTYNAAVPGGGVFPLGGQGPVLLMESSGLYNQNQFIVNANTKVRSALSLFSFYVLNRALSNTDGIGTSPANPYNYSGEYGPASTDVRHRVTAGGSVALRWSVRVSPYLVAQSRAPFDITSGDDLYGTTLFNSRPGFANNSLKPGLIATSYGLLDPDPDATETLVPRNYGRGPALIAVNLRIGKAFGFGPLREGAAKPGQGGSGPAPLGPVTNQGLRGLLGSPSAGRRYNLSVSMSIRNLLNHTNPGPIVGDITSPLFGRSNQIAGAPNGEGFFETANNRRLEMQVRLTF
ncbi:MAG: carboxypeptidase regulatory-like domain-containing protein [Bryobacteraceae bacterium]